jgi:hypothetical protein
MRIVGEWLVDDNGVTCPVVRVAVRATDGRMEAEDFLVDSGADRTVFSASLLEKLGFPAVPAPAGLTLEGVGGESEFVLVNTSVRIHSDDGGGANMHGEFAAFIEVSATEMSILAREILDHFDVILSRRRNEVLLLTKEHSYRVVSA